MMMDDDHGRTSFNDKFHFEQFRTAQATTVPIPGALDSRGALVHEEDDCINDRH